MRVVRRRQARVVGEHSQAHPYAQTIKQLFIIYCDRPVLQRERLDAQPEIISLHV